MHIETKYRSSGCLGWVIVIIVILAIGCMSCNNSPARSTQTDYLDSIHYQLKRIADAMQKDNNVTYWGFEQDSSFIIEPGESVKMSTGLSLDTTSWFQHRK